MATKTLTWVADDLSPYEANGKTTHYINMTFADDSSASLGKQDAAKAGELRDMLKALIGKEAEFGLQDKNKPNKKGQASYKLTSFPGYEPEPYTPGKSAGQVAHRNTAEGQAYEQERMDRRTSVMQAVALLVADSGAGIDDVTMTADIFYAWLRKTSASDNKGGTVMVVDALGEGPQVRGKAPARTEEGEGEGGIGKASPAPSACDHKAKTNLRPDGVELPLGRIRCEDCGKSWRVEA